MEQLITNLHKDRKNLCQNIDKYLIPQDIEKKKNAEVSTPYKLRQEMLDTITTHGDPDFWKTPKKVFEPCAGKGGFLIDIVDRFLEGGLDYKTIVEKCLYFADINPTNIYICKLLLDPHGSYALNYYQGDTLKLDIKKEWSLSGFDAVVGNPPYNNSQNNTGKRGGGDSLWNKFVLRALQEWCICEGYLIFVHPPGWRKPESGHSKYKNMFKLMTAESQMLYLSIHGIKDGHTTFNCGTRYDWYVIKKIKKYTKTKISDENGSLLDIDMVDFNWLPNYNIESVQKIIAIDGEMCDVTQSMSAYESRKKWMSDTKTEEFKYPCVHSTPKSGVRYMFSKINDKGHFRVPKIIFGEAGINDVIVDLEGQYGMTQGAMAIVVNNAEEANGIKKALLSADFKEILDSCSFGNFRIDWRMFTYFKKDFWREFV